MYAAEGNQTTHIVELSEDYCSVKTPVLGKTWNRVFIGENREAPAPFK